MHRMLLWRDQIIEAIHILLHSLSSHNKVHSNPERKERSTPVGCYCAKGSSLNFLFERKLRNMAELNPNRPNPLTLPGH